MALATSSVGLRKEDAASRRASLLWLQPDLLSCVHDRQLSVSMMGTAPTAPAAHGEPGGFTSLSDKQSGRKHPGHVCAQRKGWVADPWKENWLVEGYLPL